MRKTARAFLLDERRNVFLFRHKYNDKDRWFTPGGGIDLNETALQTLERELDEELGLDITDYQFISLNPIEYYHETIYTHERVPGKHYVWFIRLNRNKKLSFDKMSSDEKSYFTGAEWFSTDQIKECTDLFCPAEIAKMIDNFFE